MTELQQHLQYLATQGYDTCVSCEKAPEIIDLLRHQFSKITETQINDVLSYILF